MEWYTLALIGWLALALVFLGLWFVAVRTGNAGVVDVGWAYSLGALVLWYGLMTDGDLGRRILLMVLAGLWALRLGTHITLRYLREEEDGRYQMLRKHWGDAANAHFLWFFQAQALANVVLTAPILLLMLNTQGLMWADALGAGLILFAVVMERVADNQLAAWRRNPANVGKTCRKGLWQYSRHPNYFFEWLHWVGYPLIGLSLLGTALAWWWPLTLLGPAAMLWILLRATGIPYTEMQAVKSREDYRAYQQEVSPFIPWPPRTASDAQPAEATS